MSRLLLGVTGSVAAYKALELVRLATAAGHAVRVIQTETSKRFVGAASFAALTGAPVLSDEFEPDPARGAFPGQAVPDHQPLSHLELVANAHLLMIAPASAHTLAKLVGGMADNLLTSAALAATCPVAVAPAMNNRMYEHPATQANLERLRERGVTVLAPGTGRLGSAGEWGVGRMMEPEQMLAAFEALCEQSPQAGAASSGLDGSLRGVRVLISAGGTREPIDSVRYIGNRSSGRMGFALADVAAERGADVTVIAANVALERNPAVRYVAVETAAELQHACEAAFDQTDVLLMAAAVADFRPAEVASQKISKSARASLDLHLERCEDVLAGLAARRREGQTIVGFAAEHGEQALINARAKLSAKGLDAIVVNDISRPEIGFDSLENEVTVITAQGELEIPRTQKSGVASAVLDVVADLRSTVPAARG